MKKLFTFLCCMLAVIGMQAQSYVKVTSAPADWSGEYLIVYEDGKVAFNGGLSKLDAEANHISVTISNNEIAADATTNAATFTINSSGHIKSKSGYYIGNTSDSNKLLSNNTTPYTNTLSIDKDGTVNIKSSGGAYLRFNSATGSGNNRFRYYKSSTYKQQKAITLYKYTEASTPSTPSEVTLPTFNPAAGIVAPGTVVTISTNSGSTLSYTINGGEAKVTTTNTAEVTINEETTIVAKAIAADGTTETEEVTATYTLATCDNIAAFISKADTETTYEITGTVTVTYYNGKNLYVTDNSGSLLIYDVTGSYINGQTLTGVKGIYKDYKDLPEMISAILPTAVAGATVDPLEMTIEDVKDLTKEHYSRYIMLKGVDVDFTNKKITCDDQEIVLHNQFDIEAQNVTNATVVGIVGYYNDALQVQPIEVITSEPTIVAPKELNMSGFEDELMEPIELTIDALNIENPVISCELEGDNAESFEISGEYPTYTVSCFATMAAEYTARLIFSAEGAETEAVVELKATVATAPQVGGYVLVENESQLSIGNKVVIAAAEFNEALSTDQKTNNRGAVAVTKSGNTITFSNDVQVLTLDAGNIAGTFAFNTGSGYLYAASSTANNLKTKTTLDDNGSWTISIASGVATIKAQGDNTRNVMRYNLNNGSPLFACYASATQEALALYCEMPLYEDNIKSENCYFLVLNDKWKAAAGNYYAKFINKNTGAYTWVQGVESFVEFETGNPLDAVEYYLSQHNTLRSDAMPTYTHVMFFKSDVAEDELSNEVLSDSRVKTTSVAMNTSQNIYVLEGGSISTGIESVVAADGIRYAYGVVEAEGAIEVYNVNGTVVARGNDNVDLAGLGRGVYIIRNGNQVRKVVR